MFAYIVKCNFLNSASSVADQWLDWLREEHIQDVIDAGALSAEVIKLDCDNDPGVESTNESHSFEIHYRFDSRESFRKYESEHAGRLREEGLAKFPLELGLTYSRETGEIPLQQSGA